MPRRGGAALTLQFLGYMRVRVVHARVHVLHTHTLYTHVHRHMLRVYMYLYVDTYTFMGVKTIDSRGEADIAMS